MGIKERIRTILVCRQDAAYERQLAKRKVNYQTWAEKQESRQKPTGKESADILIFCQAKGTPNAYAVGWIEAYFAQNPEILIAYGDEDKREPGQERCNPWYKPGWSPDTYQSCFYVGSMIALRGSFARRLQEEGILPSLKEKYGKETSLTDRIVLFEEPGEIRRWLDKAIMLAGGFEKGCKSIGRIPQILYHISNQTVWDAYLKNRAEEASGHGTYKGKDLADRRISVIIPSKDHPQLLKQCLDSLKKSLESLSCAPLVQILVVDNGSTPENRRKLEDMLKKEVYLYCPMEFNFAKMCNLGARKADGSVYLFVNDDIEFTHNQWILEMLENALKPHAGAVGLKLYYPQSDRIQHAGITNLSPGPVHKLQGLADEKGMYFGKNDMVQNYLAVTGACMMVEKHKFYEAGGFDETLQVAYNDVDLCMKLYEAGYQNINVNTSFAYHHESFTRGNDESPEKQIRLQRELKILEDKHGKLRGKDPYYPEQLEHERLSAGIMPAYYFAGQSGQKAHYRSGSKWRKDAKRDNCVLVGIEKADERLLQGYCVVLGDDNACYEKYLLLESAEGECFYTPLTGQYRPDLEQNLPDQQNVALCGFGICDPARGLKATEYKISIVAVHRISRLKLLGQSSKVIDGRKV